jgi:hypothetical protein
MLCGGLSLSAKTRWVTGTLLVWHPATFGRCGAAGGIGRLAVPERAETQAWCGGLPMLCCLWRLR